jgi:hypothetical protein
MVLQLALKASKAPDTFMKISEETLVEQTQPADNP